MSTQPTSTEAQERPRAGQIKYRVTPIDGAAADCPTAEIHGTGGPARAAESWAAKHESTWGCVAVRTAGEPCSPDGTYRLSWGSIAGSSHCGHVLVEMASSDDATPEQAVR